MTHSKGTIAILTGGGDVPGLNPAIRAITIRALREGYRVVGIRRGWAGLVDYVRDEDADNSDNVQELSEAIVNRAGRTGGTFLHTSRTRPSHLPRERVPAHLTGYDEKINDITKDVLKNLEHIGVDALIPIGGDDTLSYGKRLHDEGVNVVAIPKTMDNDVYGTDYCIGFSTCVTRTIELTHRLRTSAGSHERFLVIEVFGRYAGFTALLPTMAGAADRCVIPEHAVDVEHLTELLTYDRNRHPSRYSVVLVSEGARLTTHEGMSFEGEETDMFGHRKLGGIGDKVAAALKEYSPQVQQRPPHRRREPAAWLPRSLRRPRRARLDRADGVRQPRARPDPEERVRPARQHPPRLLRQRADHERDVGEEGRGRGEVLQHGAAAPDLRVRWRAVVHHDERLIDAPQLASERW